MVKAELKDIEGQIEVEIDQILANYKSSSEVAASRERSLTEQLETLKTGQAAINDSSVQLWDLEREANANKALYESFLARYKQTVERQTLQVADSRMVEAATVPLAPVAPKKVKIVGMGLAGGLGRAAP